MNLEQVLLAALKREYRELEHEGLPISGDVLAKRVASNYPQLLGTEEIAEYLDAEIDSLFELPIEKVRLIGATVRALGAKSTASLIEKLAQVREAEEALDRAG